MDQSHYSKVFGLSLAAALGLMLALSALSLTPFHIVLPGETWTGRSRGKWGSLP